MGREFGVVVREFDPNKDLASVEDLEHRCEVGSLLVDLMGDPLARVRQAPAFHMLVAELGDHEGNEIVGMIRGSIRTVTRGNNMYGVFKNDAVLEKLSRLYTRLGYVSGLRVSPAHRRMGIARKLVQRLEQWFIQNGAVYAYTATENDNLASVKLFTEKCGYSKFRSPSVLVNPVFNHRVTESRQVKIIRLAPPDAESLYSCRFSATEFFPSDIGSILNNSLSLGTFLAVPRDYHAPPPSETILSDPPESWAILSVWNCKDVYRLRVRGVSRAKRLLAKATRVADGALPFLGIPSFPDLFRPFGMHFLYGIGGEGPRAADMVADLCAHAHNTAMRSGCAVLVAEVASCEPLRAGIPHWKSLSPEDLWCIKRLQDGGRDIGDGGDWTKSPPGLSIFVDPREL